MSVFAVAAFHDMLLPADATGVDAVVWVRPAGLGDDGAEVSLRVWTPVGASVAVLREVAPGAADLLADGARRDERTVDYPAGRWTDGAYEYELGVTLPERGDGDEMLAARVEVVIDGEVAGRAAVAVTSTADADRLASPRETAVAVLRDGAGARAGDRAGDGAREGEDNRAGDGARESECDGARESECDGARESEGNRAGDGARESEGDGARESEGDRAGDGAREGEGAGPGMGANADLPTGPSPEPRHTLAHAAHAGDPCPGCGEQTAEGDRFCEGCGSELAAG